MENKNNKNHILNGKNWSLDCTQPIIMGILNVTPDSFYDGGKNYSVSKAVAHAITMINEGATIIDIGGQSTRPNSTRISAQEELDRITLCITTLLDFKKDIIISVDTYHSKVAAAAIGLGAHIINDISAGSMDEDMMATVAKLDVPYIMMHMQGNPNTMQVAPYYNNVVTEIMAYLKLKIKTAQSFGIKQIVIDPGFGFGKTIEHNFEMIQHLNQFNELEHIILAGISRKSFIYKSLNINVDESLLATNALHLQCLLQGANILRVHDVAAAQQTIALYHSIKG
jgi:dihydropteroate synthase